MQELFEDTVGEQPKRSAVIVGRMQPPHVGHYAVIDAVKRYILKNPKLRLDPVPIVVIVDGKETSKDKLKNPLTADERIMFMDGSGKAKGVKFLTAGSAFDAFEAVRKAGCEPIAIAAGSDRASKYLEMLDKYFRTKTNDDIKHYAIELPRDADAADTSGLDKIDKLAALDDVLQYMGDDLPVKMISGSLARRAVQKGALGKFAVITGLSEQPKLAKLMYSKIKASMAKKETE